MFPRRVWIALIIIILLFWSGYQFVYDNRAVKIAIPKHIKYGVHLFLLVSIGFTGWMGWRTFLYKWVPSLWMVLYIIFFIIIGGLGFLDYWWGMPPSLKEFIINLKWFFASPLPFGIMMLLVKWVQVKELEDSSINK